MTTILIIACIALLFVVVFDFVFAMEACKTINELEKTVANLTIEIATVGAIAADTKFELESFRKHMDGVWDVK